MSLSAQLSITTPHSGTARSGFSLLDYSRLSSRLISRTLLDTRRPQRSTQHIAGCFSSSQNLAEVPPKLRQILLRCGPRRTAIIRLEADPRAVVALRQIDGQKGAVQSRSRTD